MSEKFFKVKSGITTSNIVFNNKTVNSNLQISYLQSNVLSFSGTSGQLFSIADTMTGTIFAVNDISGVPSIEVYDTGDVRLAETFGNVLIGSASNPSNVKFYVNGAVGITGAINANGSVGTSGQVLTSNANGIYWSTVASVASVNLVQSNVATAVTSINTVQGNVTSLTTSVNTIKANVDSVQSNIASVATSVNTVQSNLTTLTTSVNTIKANVDSVQSNIASVATSVNTVQSNLTTLTTSVNTIKANVDSVQSNIASVATSVNTVQSNLTTLTTSVNTIKANVDSVASNVSNILTGTTTFSGNKTFTGNVGIGITPSAYNLQVNGSFAATTKSFVIDHPIKAGMKLRYGSLEGPENGVYVRGRTTSNTITLPDHWEGLVYSDSITVSLTPIGNTTTPSVLSCNNKQVVIQANTIDCFYHVFGERKDVDKLVVEFANGN